MPAFYNLAELFVFPSFYEGFGMPVLEAMACGCPVIASKTGCSPEVAGGAAALVDPYSHEEIAESMLAVLGDEDTKRRMSEAGLERVKSFSWRKCAEETIDWFEALVAGEGTGISTRGASAVARFRHVRQSSLCPVAVRLIRTPRYRASRVWGEIRRGTMPERALTDSR